MLNYFETRAENYNKRSQRGLWQYARRAERQALFNLLEPKPNERILDLGCGSGHYALQLKALGATPEGLDSSPTMLKMLEHQNIPCTLGKAESFTTAKPYPKILAAGILEFVEDINAAFQQIAKALEPGGRLVILAPPSGLTGQIYSAIHKLQQCPVYLRSLNEYRTVAANQNLKFVRMIRCTPISVAMEFYLDSLIPNWT